MEIIFYVFEYALLAMMIIGCILGTISGLKTQKTHHTKNSSPNPINIGDNLIELSFEAQIEGVNVEHMPSNLSNASSVSFIDAEKNEIVFSKLNVDSDTTKYREIQLPMANAALGSMVKVTLPFTQSLFTATQLAEQAPNGLFTAIVDPSKLSHFKLDGSFTTMVHGENGIAGHGGFKQLDGIAGFNPMAALSVGIQAMAFISGQYYLESIEKTLSDMSDKLNTLIDYHNDEKLSQIITAQSRFAQLSGHEMIFQSDVDEIQSLLNTISAVYNEYRIRYIKQKRELSNYIAEKGMKKSLEILKKKTDEFCTTFGICSYAYQTYLQGAIAKINAQYRNGFDIAAIRDTIKDTIRFKNEIFDDDDFASFDSFARTIKRKASDCLEKKNIGEKIVFKFSNSERSEAVLKPFSAISESLSSYYSLFLKSSETNITLLESLDNPKKIVILPGADEQGERIFLSVS